jgi:hypothetical protein
METLIPHKPIWLSILRWTARIIALLFVIFFLFMFIGESIGSSSHNAHLHWRDYILLSLWGITIIGLLIGLWREGLGGLLSLVSTLVQIIILKSEGHSNFNYFYFYIFLVPSILYIIYWYFNKTMRAKANSTPD